MDGWRMDGWVNRWEGGRVMRCVAMMMMAVMVMVMMEEERREDVGFIYYKIIATATGT